MLGGFRRKHGHSSQGNSARQHRRGDIRIKFEGEVEFCLMRFLFWNKFRYTESSKQYRRLPHISHIVSSPYNSMI